VHLLLYLCQKVVLHTPPSVIVLVVRSACVHERRLDTATLLVIRQLVPALEFLDEGLALLFEILQLSQ
jgi:hypothetical protein